MPLIPSRVLQVYYYYIPPNEIDAGDAINILCSPIVQLNANFNKPLDGHTIEWVQLTGTAVTLEDADTLTPWFINPNTDDLSFRIYIDRYGPDEVFDDVYVFRNPGVVLGTGESKITRVLSQSSATLVQAGLYVQPRVVPRYYINNTGTGAELIGARLATAYMLEWDIPEGFYSPDAGGIMYTFIQYNFVGAYVERYNALTSTWVASAFIPKEYNYYILPFNDGTPYRLVSVWEKELITNKNQTRTELIAVRPDADSYGIFRSKATSPEYRWYANVGIGAGEAKVSSNYSFTKTISNPFRRSLLGEDILPLGDGKIARPFNDTSFRAKGKIADYTDNLGGQAGSGGISSDNYSLGVFRASGISIGSAP